MTDVQRTIARNIADVRKRIVAAANAAGRSPQNIRLVAVTKYASVEATRQLALAGLRDLGESRPQAIWEKAAAMRGENVNWHMIGHLQRNKVRRTLPAIDMIHSVDSLRLMEMIDEEAAAIDKRIAVLLEVNISGDEEKTGFVPKELNAALTQAAKSRFIEVRGLMAMAHREGGPEVARQDFAAVRELRDQLANTRREGVSLDELSLGMSGDFEEAILEGATIVRVGRALFDGIDL